MLTLQNTATFTDIADYMEDGRLTAPSDGVRYNWRGMINQRESLGRPLTRQEFEGYRL